VGYGEDSDAALGTAGMADEVRATATVGVGHGGVYDLDEVVTHHGSRPEKATTRTKTNTGIFYFVEDDDSGRVQDDDTRQTTSRIKLGRHGSELRVN
jgi:hypothetical protein